MLPDKKRLLFLDDEQQILDSLRVALRRERKRWDMRFFASGVEALDSLAKEPADLVVSDIRMPQMDGAEFLKHVASALPESVRVVLSGEAEESLTVKAIPYAHQWVSKPTDAADLVRILERALAISYLTHDSRAQEVVNSVAKLPVLPQVYQELTLALGEEEVCLDRVCALVQRQPSVSARVLQMSNSAFFGLPRPMGSIREAVGYLGLETIKNLVFAAEIICELGPKDGAFPMGQFLLEATAVSKIAGELMGPGSDGGEIAVSAGLLHDIGRLVLLQSGKEGLEYSRACKGAEETVWIEAERRIFGATHAEVGGALLGVWGLPHDLVEAVAHHHDPDGLHYSTMEPAIAVHIARAIVTQVQELSEGQAEEGSQARISPGSLALIDPGALDDYYVMARAALDASSSSSHATETA